jgi:hypothetical protein
VTDERQVLTIALMPDSRFQSTFEGIIQVPIQNYSDQTIHKENVHFQDRTGNVLDWRLLFNVQWIYSEVACVTEKLDPFL